VAGKVRIIKAGTTGITASQAGNANYNAATSITRTLTINKAGLTITANNATKISGAANPVFTAKYSGFVNGDNPTNLLTEPIFKAPTTTTPGTYDLSVSGATAANYAITFVKGSLTITPKPTIAASRTETRAFDVKEEANASDERPVPIVRNALSPNGDGINDVLVVDGLEAYPDNSLTLMTISGVKVYEIKGYDNANRRFDGHSNINGSMQKPGTYYYLLEYKDKGETKRKTGYVIIKY